MYDYCRICGTEIRSKNLICINCLNKLKNEMLEKYMNKCSICGYPLISGYNHCPWCARNTGVKLILISSYRAPWSRAVLRHWKFGEDRKLGRIISSFYLEELDKIDPQRKACCVPVPCSSIRLKERGWDQMEDICKNLKRDYCKVLEKSNVNNDEQKKLNKADRQVQASGKYTVKDTTMLKKIRNRTVFIVDDILTTGSTAASAVTTLQNAGIQCSHVICWLWEP